MQFCNLSSIRTRKESHIAGENIIAATKIQNNSEANKKIVQHV